MASENPALNSQAAPLFLLVRGSDDAAHASWYRIGDLSPEMYFEDHWSIIEDMADL